MLSMSDSKYSQYDYQESVTRIVNIQQEMESYIKSCIHGYIEDRFIYACNSDDFLDPEIKEIFREVRLPHYLMQPIHDVIAEVFRYNHHEGVQISITEDDVEEFFSKEYNDTDFLKHIDPRYHKICKMWHDFVLHELDQSFIVRTLGYSFYYFVADNDKDHHHKRSVDLSKEVARLYKARHHEIKWNTLYDDLSGESASIVEMK